jgi:Short C-terminal domain/Phospholipase_D-nuclease N-terminal
MIAASFGAGQVAYSILWFFLFFVEIWLMISIFIDIFRSHDLKGWAKASWVILVIIFPIIGILAYLIFRGDKMRAHQVQATADQEAMFRHYVQHVTGGRQSKTEELARLAELRDRGDISADEFQQLKSEILTQESTSSSI